ncbi:hypothetical protein SK128_014234 [Halocaridina rubra]|uniref:Uncharacterized protein n=1 Tax=Halocaridina rubra TaxID=373956 RepID=A0AAN8X3J8_HALRR
MPFRTSDRGLSRTLDLTDPSRERYYSARVATKNQGGSQKVSFEFDSFETRVHFLLSLPPPRLPHRLIAEFLCSKRDFEDNIPLRLVCQGSHINVYFTDKLQYHGTLIRGINIRYVLLMTC